ncbi:predicted protein [Naegleria gruberi]|uniref:Predicted protein n=1 Tax=Naegleria gruberi TaxID=5762 RepID=D2W140_NAEGR|nr:uncharacterized protein NAEGRDRAFT_75079 [Naegleria gruberi]EFC37296.1 predicted protein [Naegleria gruberi]|eukprot:XP_002670040.1 predicted protein [Naegleria gruberi strain NEG-M]
MMMMNTSSNVTSVDQFQAVLGNKFTSKNQLIEFICHELNFPLNSIINLYLVGSRLYNCHDENSDYDLFMIIQNDFTLPKIDKLKWFEVENDKILLESQKEIIQQDSIPNRNENCISFRSDLLDINIYKKIQFEFELKYFLDQSLFEIASLSYYSNNNSNNNNNNDNNNLNEIKNRERIENCILIENEKYFITNIKTGIEKSSFRSPFSRKSSNSYIKTKKKLCVEHDLRVGLKSMFHSMKILIFAIQILKFGFVYNFEEANSHYEYIMSFNNDIEKEQEWYDNVWNQLDAKFKIIKKDLEREFHLLAPKIGKQQNNKKK